MAVQGCASALLEIDSAEAGWKVKWDGCPGCRLQVAAHWLPLCQEYERRLTLLSYLNVCESKAFSLYLTA